MKKALAIILSLILLLSLTACGGSEHDEMIKEAIEELEEEWEDIYEETKESSNHKTDGHFEIKNTRVITIKENDIEEFKDVDYVIEFVLFTDYFGSAPYYSSVGLSDNVIVYKDGDMKVGKNAFDNYRVNNFITDYSNIIESIDDCGDEYNCVKKLK